MRRVRRTAFAIVLPALLGTPASAVSKIPAKAQCAMTDPADDVTFNEDGPHVSADHVDLRSVDVAVGKKDVTVVIRNTARNTQRLGTWSVTFVSGRTPIYVVARDGIWFNYGDPDGVPGFSAGVVGGASRSATGALGNDGSVKITAPLSAFGAAAPRKGTVLSGFAAGAVEMFLSLQEVTHTTPVPGRPVIGPVDRGSWPYKFTVGGACRPK